MNSNCSLLLSKRWGLLKESILKEYTKRAILNLNLLGSILNDIKNEKKKI